MQTSESLLASPTTIHVEHMPHLKTCHSLTISSPSANGSPLLPFPNSGGSRVGTGLRGWICHFVTKSQVTKSIFMKTIMEKYRIQFHRFANIRFLRRTIRHIVTLTFRKIFISQDNETPDYHSLQKILWFIVLQHWVSAWLFVQKLGCLVGYRPVICTKINSIHRLQMLNTGYTAQF